MNHLLYLFFNALPQVIEQSLFLFAVVALRTWRRLLVWRWRLWVAVRGGGRHRHIAVGRLGGGGGPGIEKYCWHNSSSQKIVFLFTLLLPLPCWPSAPPRSPASGASLSFSGPPKKCQKCQKFSFTFYFNLNYSLTCSPRYILMLSMARAKKGRTPDVIVLEIQKYIRMKGKTHHDVFCKIRARPFLEMCFSLHLI